MIHRTFARYAWGVLVYTVAVIVWGGFVRATGSGAGCGAHWPLCNGEVMPRAPALETVIELSHRITSGLSLLLVVGLFVWAFRAFPKGAVVRKGAAWSLGFMVLEALIGAGLVLLELVAYNVSVARAYWMAAHLMNTFLLLGAMSLTAWWASGGEPFRVWGQGALGTALGLAVVGTLIVGASGSVAALGDTLMIGGGLDPASEPIVAALVGLRLYHPLIACLLGGVFGVAIYLARTRRAGASVHRWAFALAGLYLAQLVVGLVNVWLMAPVWMQLVHLLMSDLVWIALVLFGAAALAAPQRVDAAALAVSRG